MYVMAVEICMNLICNFTDAIIKIVFLFEKGYGVENEKNYGSFNGIDDVHDIRCGFCIRSGQ